MKLVKDGIVKDIEDEVLAKAMISAGWKAYEEKPVEKHEYKPVEKETVR